MTQALQVLIDAVSVGSLYAMSALGIGLLFGIMRLVNFAQGEFMAVGVYVLLSCLAAGFPLAALASLCGVVGLALLTERLAFRPLRGSDPASLLVTSFAVGFLLQNALILIFGARPIGFDVLGVLNRPVLIADLRIPRLNIATVLITGVMLGGIAALLRWTRIGIEMRAAAVDFRMARLLGVRANRVIAMAFALSGLLAATTAILYVAQTGIAAPNMGLHLALVGFVATVLGGMGSLPGAVWAGLALGFVSVLLQTFLPQDLRPYRDAFVYLAVIAVLVLRPQGLFRGAATRERI